MNKIGIIGAMELEVETLKSKMTDERVITRAGMDFFEGKLNGTAAVVVRSGIGKVNAAICMQILADVFEVTHVINTGIAASLNVSLNIGDILISKDAVHHDFDLRFFGREPGEVPDVGRFFKADEKLIKLANFSCERVNPGLNAVVGRVVSGDQFISDNSVKERLISVFNGDCAEMEGASIAHCATLNNIPFVIIRAISDKADNSATMDYPTFERNAAQNSARLVEDLVGNLR